MGLDVCVHEYLEIPDTIKTQDELDKFCREHDGDWEFYRENHKNLPKKYVKKIPIELIDWDATFKKRGLNCEDYEKFRSAEGWWYEFIKKSPTPDEKENILKEGEWNTLRLRVEGNKVQTWLNGEAMIEIDDELIGSKTGRIMLQIHDGNNITVKWRNFNLTPL